MRLIFRESTANPDRVESGVRRWLTLIALLLTATGVVCDLVCFVDYFLKGEITLRFVLKCVTVLAICGAISVYYMDFLRNRVRSGVFALAAGLGAAAALVCGLTAAGTPAIQRNIEADNRRVQELRSLAGALSSMVTLPPSLMAFAAARTNVPVKDPQTGLLYEYRIKSDKEYELCAAFAADGERRYTSEFWAHPEGHACFAFDESCPVP